MVGRRKKSFKKSQLTKQVRRNVAQGHLPFDNPLTIIYFHKYWLNKIVEQERFACSTVDLTFSIFPRNNEILITGNWELRWYI